MGSQLDELIALAERTYMRMEAKELLTECMDLGDSTPFNQLLERLVMAGSTSLGVMREIIEEIRGLKSALGYEGMDVRQGLVDALSEFDVHLPQLVFAEAPEIFRQICSQALPREVRRAAGHLAGEDEVVLEEICVEAGERITRIARQLFLLGRIEEAVLDWMDGLAYQAARSGEGEMLDASSRHH